MVGRRIVGLVLLSLVLSSLCGCGASRTGGGAAGGGGAGFVDAPGASEVKTVTAKRGVAFGTVSAEGTAAVIVLPKSFAEGTDVTFTPLKPGEDGVLFPGFRIKAEGGAQPQGAVLIAFTLAAPLPEGAALIGYDDAGGHPERIPITTSPSAGGGTSVLAVVDHFTVFRLEAERAWSKRSPTQRSKGKNGFSAWRLMFDSTAPAASSGGWNSKWTFKLTLDGQNGGDITGPYAGEGTLGLDGTFNDGELTGDASGLWGFTAKVGPLSVAQVQPSISVQAARPGEPDPSVALQIEGRGTMLFTAKKPLVVYVEGEGGEGGMRQPFTTDIPVAFTLYVEDIGTSIELKGVGFFDGFAVGTLEK